MSLANLSSEDTPEASSAWSLDVPNWMNVFKDRENEHGPSELTILVEDLDFVHSSWEMYFSQRREPLKGYLDPDTFLAELPELAKLQCPKRFFLDCDIGPGHDGAGPRLARAIREVCPDSQIFLETSYSRLDFAQELASGVLDDVYKKAPERIFEPDPSRKDGFKDCLDIRPIRVAPRPTPQLPEPPECLPGSGEVRTLAPGEKQTRLQQPQVSPGVGAPVPSEGWSKAWRLLPWAWAALGCLLLVILRH